MNEYPFVATKAATFSEQITDRLSIRSLKVAVNVAHEGISEFAKNRSRLTVGLR